MDKESGRVVNLYSPQVFGADPYSSKSPVIGRVVAVLRGRTEQRALQITAFRSRAVPAGEIHELMVTDEAAELESQVNRVALVAFFEITSGGVILVGDRVLAGETEIGVVAGFDETHMPNHQNICLRGEWIDGESRALMLEQEIRIARD
jgi:hypothetical protein